MKRIILLLLLILVLYRGGQARAAIAFDNAAGGNCATSVTTCSTSAFTVSSAANTGLAVCVMTGSSTDDVTGVTFNGVSATRVAALAGDNVTVGYTYLYWLIAPTSGSHVATATTSAGEHILITASSYTGVAQTGIPEASATHQSASGTTLTGTVTTITANDWVVSCGGDFNLGTTAGTNTTFRANDGYTGTGLTFIGDNNAAIASPTAYSMTYTLATSAKANIIVGAIQPPTSAIAPGNLTLSSVTKTQAVMALSAQSGGTGPYTCQWYRSTTGGFTPGAGNIISGATSCSALTDTPGSVGPWFYQVVVTDSATPTPGTATSNQLGASLYTGTNVVLGCFGDSIFSGYLNNGGSSTTTGNDPCTFASQQLQAMNRLRGVTVINVAYAGTTTANWLPSAGAGCGSGSISCYNQMLTAFTAAGVTVIAFELEANDAQAGSLTPAATSITNDCTIANALKTQYSVPILWFQSSYAYPGAYTNTWTNASTGIMSTYNSSIASASCVDGKTIIYANGDGGKLWPWSINNYLSSTYFNTDNVHPNVTGDWAIYAPPIACAVSNVIDANSCRLSGGGGGGYIVGGWNHLRPPEPLRRQNFKMLAHFAANSNFPMRRAQ